MNELHPIWLRNEAMGWFWSSRCELKLSDSGKWVAKFGRYDDGSGFIFETHAADKTGALIELYQAVKAHTQRETQK